MVIMLDIHHFTCCIVDKMYIMSLFFAIYSWVKMFKVQCFDICDDFTNYNLLKARDYGSTKVTMMTFFSNNDYLT